MLEPIRVPLIKTNEEFYERNFKKIGPEIWSRSPNDPRKPIIDALSSGTYYMTGTCERFSFQRRFVEVYDKEYLEKTYLVEEPYSSLVKNLFVPFTNSYVDKFQG